MNIMVIANTKFYKYLMVLMAGLFKNHHNVHFVFFIVYKELSEQAKKELKDYAEKNNSECSFIYRSTECFNGLKVIDRFPIELYWKLVPHYVISDVDRVMYLDIDMAVDGDLTEVYNRDFPADCCFLACRDVDAFVRHNLRGERGTVASNYVNSGFMLVNLKRLREKKITIDYYLEYLKKKKQRLFEEELLNNTLINGELCHVEPYDYNYNIGADIYYREYADNSNISIKRTIRHYLTHRNRKYGKFIKPWNIFFEKKPEKDEVTSMDFYEHIMTWWKYAQDTPYYDELLRHARSNVRDYYEMYIKRYRNAVDHIKLLTGIEIVRDDELLSFAKWSDGDLIYIEDGEKNKSFTGLSLTEKGNTVYFENGVFQKNYSGTVRNISGTELYFDKGIHQKLTGAFWVDKELIFFNEGVRDSSFTGVAVTQRGNYVMFTNGIINRKFTGLINDNNGRIIFMRNGMFDDNFSGIYKGRQIKDGVLL